MSLGLVPIGKHNQKDASWVNPLANAIIGKAIVDYVDALLENHKAHISECEAFFKGKWFNNLSYDNMDSERLLKRARRYAKEFAEEVDNHQPFRINCKAALQDCSFLCPICKSEVIVTTPKPTNPNSKPLFTRIVNYKCPQCRIHVRVAYKQSRITILDCEHCEHCYPFQMNAKAPEILLCDYNENDHEATNYTNLCEHWERRFNE